MTLPTITASPVRAVQYMRMSRDSQRYSIANQSDRIREYAAHRNLTIVRTYADEGRSGLRLQGRRGLQQLLADVESGTADFQVILVYDVSRWGRFQDADESAYYEYVCRRAGIEVAYCAELFENDGSPMAALLKGLKRVMAGEYSRELSNKVFVAHCRQVELGYWQGGPAGYALQRVMVDPSGAVKGVLGAGEYKNLHSDRVILQPGPAEEVAVVQQIYGWFIDEGLTEFQIKQKLNAAGVPAGRSRRWTRYLVREVLFNEKYIGTIVYNRQSVKLGGRQTLNDPAMWIRKPGAFVGIVSPERFRAARAVRETRENRLNREVMLGQLRAAYQRHGLLSREIIDADKSMPSTSTYAIEFGTLLKAYQAVGYTPLSDRQCVRTRQLMQRQYLETLDVAVAAITRNGGAVERHPVTGMLTINQKFTVWIKLMPAFKLKSGPFSWHVIFRKQKPAAMTVAVRLAPDDETPLDYYLLPNRLFNQGSIHFYEYERPELAGYRFKEWDGLYSMIQSMHHGASG